MDVSYSFYLMENNQFLGNCLSVVVNVGQDSRKFFGLTGDNIIIFIKFGKDIDYLSKNISFDSLINSSNFISNKSILLRVGSECMFGTYGDSHCDCEDQRINSLKAINENGQGVYVHMPQEAQGQGLFYKAKELSLQVTGHDQDGKYVGQKSVVEASKVLLNGHKLDIRNFGILKQIFSELRLDKLSYVVIASNPNKISFLKEEVNLTIENNTGVKTKVTKDNLGEYLGKLYQKNFSFTPEIQNNILSILNGNEEIPDRALDVLKYIKQDHKNNRSFSDNFFVEKMLNTQKAQALDPHNELSAIFDTSIDNNPVINLLKTENVSYKEFNIAFITNEHIFEVLAKIFGSKYLDYAAYETLKYYDVFKDETLSTTNRQLKIRVSKNIFGMKNKSRTALIYKVLNKDNYEISKKEIDNVDSIDLFHLFPNVFFQSKIRECITIVNKIELDLVLLVKIYPGIEYAVEIMGDERKVNNLFGKISKSGVLIKQVDLDSLLDAYGNIIQFTSGSLKENQEKSKKLVQKYFKAGRKEIFLDKLKVFKS